MEELRHGDRPSFLGTPVGASFERRVVTVAPGETRAHDPAEWHDAIVVIERGEIELVGGCGRRIRLLRGDLLWLAELPLQALHNPGDQPAVLVAISRGRRHGM